jgi:hypothetical protein
MQCADVFVHVRVHGQASWLLLHALRNSGCLDM